MGERSSWAGSSNWREGGGGDRHSLSHQASWYPPSRVEAQTPITRGPRDQPSPSCPCSSTRKEKVYPHKTCLALAPAGASSPLTPPPCSSQQSGGPMQRPLEDPSLPSPGMRGWRATSPTPAPSLPWDLSLNGQDLEGRRPETRQGWRPPCRAVGFPLVLPSPPSGKASSSGVAASWAGSHLPPCSQGAECSSEASWGPPWLLF